MEIVDEFKKKMNYKSYIQSRYMKNSKKEKHSAICKILY